MDSHRVHLRKTRVVGDMEMQTHWPKHLPTSYTKAEAVAMVREGRSHLVVPPMFGLSLF